MLCEDFHWRSAVFRNKEYRNGVCLTIFVSFEQNFPNVGVCGYWEFGGLHIDELTEDLTPNLVCNALQ